LSGREGFGVLSPFTPEAGRSGEVTKCFCAKKEQWMRHMIATDVGLASIG
jgi:hypothetical protein